MSIWSALISRIYASAVRVLHGADYAFLLPLAARLPFVLGYSISALRGRMNGLAGRDWRSMALGTRHVARQSAIGYRMLFPDLPEDRIMDLVRMRFEIESREEFEGQLIVAGRVPELHSTVGNRAFLERCRKRTRGLMLLTPHFDSFMMGIVLLGLQGVKLNLVTSSITSHPAVVPEVRTHFYKKYRGMERLMNGGVLLDHEDGLRPFYQMLKRGECVVISADSPAAPGGATVTPHFLGAPRVMAGGALRMARKTGSDLGAFVCHYDGRGRYRVEGGPIVDAALPEALNVAYGFLSEAIMASPGRWCATDLLPTMTQEEG